MVVATNGTIQKVTSLCMLLVITLYPLFLDYTAKSLIPRFRRFGMGTRTTPPTSPHTTVTDLTTTTTTTAATTNRLVFGKDDIIFGAIEDEQGSEPFGDVLDAGTGLHSLRWLATLSTPGKGLKSLTAVTADAGMHRTVTQEVDAVRPLIAPHPLICEVLIGNWFAVSDHDNNNNNKITNLLPWQLEGRSFDTILLDYLIGAMDGFSPYKQDQIIPLLTRFLKPGGRMYIVGLEPLPDPSTTNDRDGGNIMCRVRQVRDACILLAGHRCYREYPLEWVERQIQQHGEQQDRSINHTTSLRHISSRRFPILYRHATIVKQINVARSKLPLFPSKALAASMREVLDELEKESLTVTQSKSDGKIRLGFDYLVAVQKSGPDETEHKEL